MRDGKKVKVPRAESSKTGTGFALNYPIDSDGRAFSGLQGRLGEEAVRVFLRKTKPSEPAFRPDRA
jgi:hypothetical protein